MSKQNDSKDTRQKNQSKGNYSGRTNYKNDKPYKKHGNSHDTKRNYADKSASNDTDSSGGTRRPYDSYRSNDIGWWNKSPMYSDVTRVPFNQIYGSPLYLRTDGINPTLFEDVGCIYLGGIMSIDIVPTIGTAIDGNDAVNRAFNSLFGELYSKTTGTPPIQQMDVAMFITSLSSVACLIGYLKRALGVSQLYSNQNYNYPTELLTAMHIDPTTVIGWQDEIRYKLNDLILNFNNLKVPDIMDIYVRQYALVHNVYCDEDDVQAQLYVFNPRGYYKYIDTATPAKLAWTNFTYSGERFTMDVNDVIAAANACLEAWRNSSDLGLICGTIQRAFSETVTISLDYVNPTDVVIPTIDRNIMWQINNMNIVRVLDLDITQDPVLNILKFDPTPYRPTDTPLYTDSYLLNSFDGTTTDEFIMESTRLKSFRDPDTDVIYFNTEIVVGCSIHYVTDVEGTIARGSYDIDSTELIDVGTTPAGNITVMLMVQALASQFKYRPMTTVWYRDTTQSPKFRLFCNFGDLYRYTTVTGQALYGIHRCALQSIYKLFIGGK